MRKPVRYSKKGCEIDDEELEILKGCDKLKRDLRLPFCEITHVIGVMRKLGWSKANKGIMKCLNH